MTHLFREEDFHEGQKLTLVERSYRGEERSRTPVTVVRVKHGTMGKMKGRLQVTVQRSSSHVITVLPSETGNVTTLEA